MEQRLNILIPLYNEWPAAAQVMEKVSQVMAETGKNCQFVLVDDGSTEPRPDGFGDSLRGGNTGLTIIELKRNLGHQRAIAIGMCYLGSRPTVGDCVVMDSDGEDAPEDVPRLLKRMEEEDGKSIVFAERTQRSERALFRICYIFYRWLHRVATGTTIRFGNFSVIPGALLGQVVSVSEIWNHYAAAVVRNRIPISLVPTKRVHRITGESKMNFTGLVNHGLGAISVFGETVGIRLFFMSFLAALVFLGLLILDLGGIYFFQADVPSWVLLACAILFIFAVLGAMVSLQTTLFFLHSRSQLNFVPALVYDRYVKKVESIL